MTTVPDPVASKLLVARTYVDRGWKIFMLGAGKTPLPNCESCASATSDHDKELCDCLTCHGFYAATSDVARLEVMAMLNPAGFWAVRCGQPSGVIVIDADVDRGGLDTLDEWESWTQWSLPETLRASTSSGGVHLFYEWPGSPIKSRNGVLPGVDVKADGGYVALPSGDLSRRWLNELNVAALDGYAVTWLAGARSGNFGGGGAAGEGYDYALFTRDGCPGGHRDFFFNDMAYRLRKSGAAKSAATVEIRRHWERAAQPPNATYHMPWEHCLYKIERVWREVDPDPANPEWQPAQETLVGGAVVGVSLTEHTTDLGNANRLVRLLGDQIRFVPELDQWIVWNGNRWVPDVEKVIMQYTVRVIEDLRTFAETLQDREEQRRVAAFALASESLRGRQNMVRSASVDPRVITRLGRLDADPWSLVVGNGTLNLRTGTLRDSVAADLNTRQAAVDFDPEARCPLWDEHIAIVTNGDPVLASYLRRAVGYSLTGLVTEQVFFMLEGTGANGKNAFIEPIVAILGDYAQTGTSALITGGDEQHPTILADLVGARLVFIDEARQGRPLNVERVKQLTGSRSIKARRMKQDFFEFPAHLKLWIAGNNHPTMRDPSDGVWRRLHRVLFNAKIAPDRIVKDYGVILFEQESVGILNWALRGLEDWRELQTLGQPPAVVAATEELKSEEDFVQQFIEERLVVSHDPGDAVSNNELYSEYCIWATLSGLTNVDRLNRVQFGRQFAAKGFTRFIAKIDGRAQRGFSGVKVYRT